MIVLIIVAAILAIMGVVILIGKGDNLIAGYNTASEQEKAKYNIKRLRGLLGGFLIILAPMLFTGYRKFVTMTMILDFVIRTLMLRKQEFYTYDTLLIVAY